jgi:6-phosphogluconolactonase
MEDIAILTDANALAHKAAECFCVIATQAIAKHGKFTVALSGGRTPKALYELLATEARYREGLKWNDMYFFFGDERHVPPNHQDSNFRMVDEALFKRIPVSQKNIFRVNAELADADEAARLYQQAMEEFFSSSFERGDGFPIFDLIFLGTGPDGHTASLFPDSSAMAEDEKWVVANWVKKFASRRISLTFPVLNHAREVVVLVSGRDKAPIIKKIFDKSNAVPRYPIQFVVPQNGRKLWLLDQDAYFLVKHSSSVATQPI